MRQDDLMYIALKIIIPLVLVVAIVVGVSCYFIPANSQNRVSCNTIARLTTTEKEMVNLKILKTHAPLTEAELANIKWDYNHTDYAARQQMKAADD